MKYFKRKLACVLACTLMIQGTAAFAEAVYDKAVPGWTVYYADDASGTTAYDKGETENDAALALNSEGKGEIALYQSIATQKGSSYECAVRVKTKNVSSAYLYAGDTKSALRQGNSDWTTYRLAFTAQGDTSEIGIKINQTGSVVIDSFFVTDKNGRHITVENASFDKSGSNTSSSTVSVSGGIDTSKSFFDSHEIPYFYSTQKKVPLFYAENINIDGDASDWVGYPSVYLPADAAQVAKLKSWDGIEDLSASIYMTYDDEAFYLCAVVMDDEHWIKPEQYWAGDCLQLGFTRNGNYGPEIGLFFDEKGNYIDSPIGKEEEMTFVGKRKDNISTYEYKIPWSTLYGEKPSDHIVFNILIDDGDSAVRQAFIEWTAGIGYAKSADSITMQFVKKEDNTFAQWIDAPAEITVGQQKTLYVNLLNRSDQTESRTVRIPSLDVEQTVEVAAGGLYRIPFTYKAEKPGIEFINVTVEGKESKIIKHQLKIVEIDPYQDLDLSNLEGGKIAQLESLINQCRDKGIAIDYELLDLHVIKRFVTYYYDDLSNGYTERATYVANNMERMADEAIANLNAYLNGTKESFPTQRYLGGDLRIDGYNLWAKAENTLTGEVTERPVFLGGYGHTTNARDDILDLPNFGANIFQHELGVYHTISGYSTTPEAENIMDRFVFTDKEYLARIEHMLQKATATNQAVDMILSPHYFPAFVQTAHPETLAPAQGGMNKRINLYADKAKEAVEAHTRWLLNKLKDYPIVKSICLTNEPAIDVRNCYELGNMKNPVTAAWVAYLKESYGTISKLNKIYESDYSNFEEVAMIKTVSNNVQTYDWMIFNNKMFADWHHWLADIVHEIMPDIPVHAKIMDPIYSNAVLGQGTDPELFAEFCGFSGNDAYFTYPSSNPVGKYLWYDFEGSMKKMPIFDSENHIITDGDSKFIPQHAYQNGTDIWQGALHGRTLTCIWVWGRSETAHALSGSLLYRPDVVSELGKNILDLNRLSYEAAAINDEPFKVGVFYSWTSRVYDTAYISSTNTAYAGSSYTGEKTGFITETQLGNRQFNDYKIIIVPYAPYVPEKAVEGLREFIEQGGKVFIMGGTSLTNTERKEKNRSDALAYVQSHAVYWDKDRNATLTNRDVTSRLFEAYKEMEDIGNVKVFDILTGEPVQNVEWRSTKLDGHTIINLCNYTWDANREVYITVDGVRVSQAYDLKNNEKQNGLIMLNSYVPRLLRVDAVSDTKFEDIEGHWARLNIERLTLRGILSGISPTEFMPDKGIASQELLMAIMRYKGIECAYEDVFEKAGTIWNLPERFVNKPELTREEVAELIYLAFDIMAEGELSGMSDVNEVSENAYPAMSALFARGIMVGRSETTLNPKDVFTRAEAISVLSRL